MDFFDNAVIGASTQSNPGQMTLYVFPFTPVNEVFPGDMTVSTVMLNVTQSLSTAATFTNQVSLAFYSSVNSTQLTRVFSGSTSWGTAAGNMSINDSFGGTRWLSIHSSNFDVAPTFCQGRALLVPRCGTARAIMPGRCRSTSAAFRRSGIRRRGRA